MSEGTAKKEEKPRKFQAIRGTRDLLPPETALWNRVEQIAQEVFTSYGFGEIRLPIFEPTELFARSIGIETDVVSKEMYTFETSDAPDLVSIRLRRLLKQNNQYDPPDVLNVLDSELTDFGMAVQEAFNQGRIPKTPDNLALLSDLRTEFDQVVQVLRDPPSQARSGVLGGFDVFLERFVRLVRLGDSVTLRPEATASVCRAYIENGMQQVPQPVKLYYMGPMFRRERPQKGRYRQFYQIGAEVLENTRPDAARDPSKELSKDAVIDAEVIEMLTIFFDRVGLQGTELNINSIGDKNCRPQYVELLRGELRKVKDKLGPDSQRRIETNPLRVLDSKFESEQGIIATLPRIADHLCDECKMHYTELKRQLDLRGFKGKYKENWRLVRGLDYYMRTTFEITARGLGSQDAVCGGGRYDGLVELLGGPPTKGIGFAIGEDRVVLSLVHDKPLAQRRDIDLVLAWLSPETYTKAIELARNLRREGVKVDIPTKLMRAGDAVRYADRIGAYFTLLLGEDELKSGQLTLKHMLRQEQMKITEVELLSHLKHQNEMREGRSKK